VGLFRRRRGRHELGGAVRDIPHAAPPVLVHPPLPASLPVQADAPRVELGFRDGSTAALAPDSPQSRALVALASVMVKKD
jgi:hypothetical protein